MPFSFLTSFPERIFQAWTNALKAKLVPFDKTFRSIPMRLIRKLSELFILLTPISSPLVALHFDFRTGPRVER